MSKQPPQPFAWSLAHGETHKGFTNGVQPAWQALQLPASLNTENPGTPDNNSTSSMAVGTPTNVTNTTLDIPRRIALSLFWCWTLFVPQQRGKQEEKEIANKT